MKQNLSPIKQTHFGIARKIVSNMTSESWETIPHAVVTYEPECTKFMQVVKELKRLEKTFGSHVTDKEEYIKSHWLGRRTSDCVGLIKGYGWYDETSGIIKYGTNEMKDVTADGMFNAAVEKGPISTMPDIPGIAVWHQGHIGVYIGNGYVIHAANTYDGVIKTPITSSGWTHWLKVPYINYIEETEADSN